MGIQSVAALETAMGETSWMVCDRGFVRGKCSYLRGEGVVVPLPRELGLDKALRGQRLASLFHIQSVYLCIGWRSFFDLRSSQVDRFVRVGGNANLDHVEVLGVDLRVRDLEAAKRARR